LRIYTIGHSDHSISAFVDLLRTFDIALLVDVRSQPYSRWTPQFNREDLAHDLQEAGIAYKNMGDSLGGRPADPTLYDPGAERPDYERMAQTPVYQSGIVQLLDLARAQQVVVMCSEGDFHQCHRHKLITQTLLERGIDVQHIQPDGATAAGEIIPQQLSLF
jgi:uncharacterized protein (DUF488 family)